MLESLAYRNVGNKLSEWREIFDSSDEKKTMTDYAKGMTQRKD